MSLPGRPKGEYPNAQLEGTPVRTAGAHRAAPHHEAPMSWRRRAGLVFTTRTQAVAVSLMAVALLLLLAGWTFPELWRPAWAEWRSPALLMLSAGAFLMWRHALRVAERRFDEALSSLTHSTLMPYEFAPETLPMEDPAAPALAAAADPAEPGTATPMATEVTAAMTAASAPTSATTNAAPSASTSTSTSESASAPTVAPVPAPAAPLQWTAGLLRALEWRRFEALCEEIFKQDGYVTKPPPGSTERGADIWLHSRLDLQQPVRIVQCRNWSGEPVGVNAVREFLGAMVDADVKSGALVTCGAFTAEAQALARRHAIMAVSGADVLALIAKRPQALQHELLAVATQGDYGRPTCKLCGLKMQARQALDGELTHWVCEGAPRCPGVLDWTAGPA